MNAHDWNPGSLLELSGSYWRTCTLHAAVKLDIFTAMGDEALGSGRIAAKIKSDPDGTDRLLNALVAMGLLRKTGNNYHNTDATKTFLSKSSDKYLGHIIMHHHHLVESWSKLGEAVHTGSPIRDRSTASDESKREAFLMGMFNIAMQMAPTLVREFDLSTCKTLLDLGGGPGTYAIHFCLNNPELSAVVFDLPATRPFAEKTIEQFGLGDRIRFVPGDFVTDPFDGSYDAVWMSHILHGEGPETCHRMIQKASEALSPGGMILIHEFILDNTRDNPVFPALFSMNMLLGTESGRSYTEKELEEMLLSAGMADIKRSPYCGPTESGVITGVKNG